MFEVKTRRKIIGQREKVLPDMPLSFYALFSTRINLAFGIFLTKHNLSYVTLFLVNF